MVPLLLLPILPLLPLALGEYSDYSYDRTVPNNAVLDTAAIYEGIFSYDNIVIMQIQNLMTFLATALAWQLVMMTFPPSLGAGRVRRAAEEGEEGEEGGRGEEAFTPSAESLGWLLHTLGDAAEKYAAA